MEHKGRYILATVGIIITTYISGAFFAGKNYREQSMEEILMLRNKANKIQAQGLNIKDNIAYMSPDDKLFAEKTLDSLIREKQNIDSIISIKILHHDSITRENMKESWYHWMK